MPCYNGADYLARSVWSVMAQSHSDLELIIVDDKSTDNSVERIKYQAGNDKRIVPIFHEQNRGASAARNTALDAATGDFVAFLDVDDAWFTSKLERQLLMLEGSGADVSYTNAEIMNKDGYETGKLFSDSFPLPNQPDGYIFTQLILKNWINISTVLAKREAIGSHRFNENIRLVEDWAFWITLARANKFDYLINPLSYYRDHDSSIGLFGKKALFENRINVYLDVLKSYCAELPDSVLAQIFYHLGCALKNAGDATYARRSFRTALAHDPFLFKAFARLALCSLQR